MDYNHTYCSWFKQQSKKQGLWILTFSKIVKFHYESEARCFGRVGISYLVSHLWKGHKWLKIVKLQMLKFTDCPKINAINRLKCEINKTVKMETSCSDYVRTSGLIRNLYPVVWVKYRTDFSILEHLTSQPWRSTSVIVIWT